MKKIVLALLLAAGFQQLRAQNLVVPTLPNLSFTDGTMNLFKPQTDKPLQQFAKPDLSTPVMIGNNGMVIKKSSVDNMPIAYLPNNNSDHMPVTGASIGNIDHMPIVGGTPVEGKIEPVPAPKTTPR